MVMAYFMAQLMPWATDQAMQGDAGPGWGSLLVLGSANVDEALRGYYTKYDCSAADVNPIGGINKRDLKAFLIWAAKERGIGELERVANAVPTAELRPDKATFCFYSYVPISAPVRFMAAMAVACATPSAAPWRNLLAAWVAWGSLWAASFCGLELRCQRSPRMGCRIAEGELSTEESEDLLVALGRNLWAAADELLEVSALLAAAPLSALDVRKFSPQGLGAAALALRNAADMMLDEDWESAMGELEVASVSSEGFLPPASMQGLIDLFAYEEAMPSCEWQRAKSSLRRLSKNLADVAEKLSGGEVVNSLKRSSEFLSSAARLFVPGGFEMPPDPRIYRGPRGETQRDFYGSFYVPPEKQYVEDAPPGSPAAKILETVQRELAEAGSSSSARRQVLRRLVRRLHPDQNRGKEEEVTPAFRYIQRIRSEEMDQRRKKNMGSVALLPCRNDILADVEGGKKVEEQSDEKDMGMSYDELGDLGHLRKVEKCGPLSTFLKLRQLWSHKTAEWTGPQDNDKAITPSIRVKVQPKTFDEKVAQKENYVYDDLYGYSLGVLQGQGRTVEQLKDPAVWNELARAKCEEVQKIHQFTNDELVLADILDMNLPIMAMSHCSAGWEMLPEMRANPYITKKAEYHSITDCKKITDREYARHHYMKCLLGINNAAADAAYLFARACLLDGGSRIGHFSECPFDLEVEGVL
ncbi:unnamed protein product [Cladocopium goreaui]|uniref:NAD(+) synthase (Glutamine-hydrolyzing) (NAD(+ ) synthase [glutamine-hydrolyzing]) n=1 Tax=Cladocopium goreaui TaxID=2562237 RepID=A0A9P1G9B0_9DINO|nr:unnamed protein product [Cladocopium goreaui]